jgi:hypothetical protein
MNTQDFIDRHFVTFFPLYFVPLWLFLCAIISYVGGWFSLSRVFRTEVPFNGSRWGFQSGQMRWLTNYGNCLTLGADQHGIYLAIMFLFRFMHPPLLVPWSEVTIRRKKGWVFEYVTFIMGRETAIPLRIRGKMAGRLRDAAGGAWPIEET